MLQKGPTIPWGDVSTAYHTTGIPNIRVYFAASPRAIRDLRRGRIFMPLAKLGLPVLALAGILAGQGGGVGCEALH